MNNSYKQTFIDSLSDNDHLIDCALAQLNNMDNSNTTKLEELLSAKEYNYSAIKELVIKNFNLDIQ